MLYLPPTENGIFSLALSESIGSHNDVILSNSANSDGLLPRTAHNDLILPSSAHNDLILSGSAHNDLILPGSAHNDLILPDSAHNDVISSSESSCSPRLVQHSLTTGFDTCHCCQMIILEQYAMEIDGHKYHVHCLRCNVCMAELDSCRSAYVRDGLLHCKNCYYLCRLGRQCVKCNIVLLPDDIVMRAKDAVYHVQCFSCTICHKMLNAGEIFVMNERCEIFCQVHSEHILMRNEEQKVREESEETEEYNDEEPSSNGRSKRMRTSFKHHQLKAMKVYFSLNHNPDAKDLKHLAQKTGLTKRVLQVWFQNARAKYRRSMQSGGCRDGQSMSPSSNLIPPAPTLQATPLSIAPPTLGIPTDPLPPPINGNVGSQIGSESEVANSSSSAHSSDYTMTSSPNEFQDHAPSQNSDVINSAQQN